MGHIIDKIEKAKLLGRGGAGFPACYKWRAVKNASGFKKYIICNASEGEPDVFKDKYILENYPEEVINGIEIALNEIGNSSAYIYLNSKYYLKFKNKLEKLIGHLPIEIFKKPENYIGGEETTLLNVIEGKREEPRMKPPFPTESGLFGCPTLINNVETFYHVSKIEKDEYKGTKFYSISGDVKHKGVFELSEIWSIKKILRETNNWPNFDFFVKTGGGATGSILLKDELDGLVEGAGAIIVFDTQKTKLIPLMKKWAEFFLNGNCDKCTPCREGMYRILEVLNSGKELDKQILDDIFFVLEKTSYCPLGKGAYKTFKDLINKIQ
jgi:NADH:ubiquinone oxidoreductase subunit F (NADH-binding)